MKKIRKGSILTRAVSLKSFGIMTNIFLGCLIAGIAMILKKDWKRQRQFFNEIAQHIFNYMCMKMKNSLRRGNLFAVETKRGRGEHGDVRFFAANNFHTFQFFLKTKCLQPFVHPFFKKWI